MRQRNINDADFCCVIVWNHYEDNMDNEDDVVKNKFIVLLFEWLPSGS